jgi:single-stranded-DNA-specific exonuclease
VPLSALTKSLVRNLVWLEPYGADNPKPRFLAAGLKVESFRRMSKGEVQKHLDIRVR